MLPEWHTKNPPLRSIYYINEVQYTEPNRAKHRTSERLLGQCRYDTEAKIADITLYRQQEDGNNHIEDFKFSILHEVGHAVFFGLPAVKVAKWYGLYAEAGGIILWNYAGLFPDEHFADSYAYFFLYSVFMEKRMSREFAFMSKEIFGGHQ